MLKSITETNELKYFRKTTIPSRGNYKLKIIFNCFDILISSLLLLFVSSIEVNNIFGKKVALDQITFLSI